MADQLQSTFNTLLKNVDDDMNQFTPLKNLASRCHLRLSHLVLGMLFTVVIFTLLGVFQHFLVTFFGMLYPAYMSFKAIEQKSEPQCKKWMTYWMVFGFATAFDRILKILLFFLPGYYTLKLIFYIWLFYPKTNGSKVVFQKLLKPYLGKFKAGSKAK